MRDRVDDAYLETFAAALIGELGGKVGVVPRVFARKLIGVLDRVDLHAEFDPRVHCALAVDDAELTAEERNARAAASVDDIDLDL